MSNESELMLALQSLLDSNQLVRDARIMKRKNELDMRVGELAYYESQARALLERIRFERVRPINAAILQEQ